jgi:hypothetical protein
LGGDVRLRLLELAGQVAAELNVIVDDDEREGLQEAYEHQLNNELFAGSVSRAAGVRCVVHQPVAVSLREGQSVIDAEGRYGVIAGFMRSRSWAGRKPVAVLWAIVQHPDGRRRYMRPDEIRVVETTTPVNEREASQR